MTTNTRAAIFAGTLALVLWIPSSVGQSSLITSTTLYMKSIGKLCGWADCRGWCEYHNRVTPIGDVDGTECRVTAYNRAVTDSYNCDSKVCVTLTDTGGSHLCRPSADTQTACYHLYRNASTNRVQTRICLDPNLSCLDLVNFCRSQSSFVCTAYRSNPAKTVPTVSPAVSSTSQGNSNSHPYVSGPATNSSTDLIPATGTPEAFTDGDFPFLAGIVIGFGVAAVPIIILTVILLCMKKRLRKGSIKVGEKKNPGIELGDNPVYASIGPELPTRGPTLHNPPDISSSARSLHITGRRPTQLLGNLHRNKSLPELVFESGSIPMESNDILRAVAMPDRLSSSTDEIQIPSDKRSPDTLNLSLGLYSLATARYDSPRISPSTDDILYPSRMSPGTPNLPPGLYDQPVTKQDGSRKISPRYSGQGISNKLYSGAIVSGRPSYHADDDDKDEYQNVDSDLLDKRRRLEQRFHGHYKKRPSLENVDPSGSTGQGSIGLEQHPESTKGPIYSPIIQTKKGLNGNEKQYVSPGAEAPTGALSRPVHMGLMSDNQETKASGRPQPDRGYMGLDNSSLSPKTNPYMGIGDGVLGSPGTPESPSGKVTPVVVGKGAYTELNLLESSSSKPNEYMGLATDDKSVQDSRKKYWKSKSTYQNRFPPTDGSGGSQAKTKKKSFLFRSKRRDKPSRKPAGEVVADGDMCLDLNIATSSPLMTDTKPHYFTLESDTRRSTSKNGHIGGTATSEYKQPGPGDNSPMDEPFRSRSQSQPVRKIRESTEEYEMIKDSWRPTIFPKPPVKN